MAFGGCEQEAQAHPRKAIHPIAATACGTFVHPMPASASRPRNSSERMPDRETHIRFALILTLGHRQELGIGRISTAYLTVLQNPLSSQTSISASRTS